MIFSDRVRFNWGFWDGRAQARATIGRPSTDRAHESGYELGSDPEYQADATSDRAWTAHRSAVEARRAVRRRLPPRTDLRV